MSKGLLLRALGLDGTTGRVHEPLPVTEARAQVARALRRPRPPRYGVVSADLASAGWGVVFAEDVTREVREALRPLLDQRRRDAGDRFQDLSYEPGESTTEFRNRLRSGHGRVEPRQMPWYLMLVGSPASMPYGFELDLGLPHAVGRLFFEEVDDYRAYAMRVLEAERQVEQRRPRAAVFAPTHPEDPSTPVSVEHLAVPLLDVLESRGTLCSAKLREAATCAALLDLVDQKPDLLVTVGHAVQYSLEHTDWQRARQGALVGSEWPGQGGTPPEHTVAAEDLPPGALEKGVAVLFGCYTAGTPAFDPYESDLPDEAPRLAHEAFVAALPKRLLGSHGGALAVLGHVGRTFEASFRWRGASQIAAFEDTIRALLDGQRLGVAIDGFGQRFADLAIAWSRNKTDPDVEDHDSLGLWIAFQEARSWALLGDPAVRLLVAAA